MNHYQFTEEAQFSYLNLEACMAGLGAALDAEMLEHILLAYTILNLNTFQAHGFLVHGDTTVGSDMAVDLSFMNKTDRVSRYLVILYKKMLVNDSLLVNARVTNTLNHYGYIQPVDTLLRKQRINKLLE